MYCKRCHILMDENTLVCQNCNYSNIIDETTEIDLKQIEKFAKNKRTKKTTLPIFIIFMFLSFGIILIYIIDESKAIEDKITPIPSIDSTTSLDKTFEFNDFILKYPETFGASANTIFYKNNNEYNVVIKNITEQEYKDAINSMELLNSKLGSIDTVTFANDNSYSHVFFYNNQYYDITVNYSKNDNSDNTKLQSDLSKIINSLQKK